MKSIADIEFPVILTGPPGAGKSTFVKYHWPHAIKVDVDGLQGTHKQRIEQRNALAFEGGWQVFMTAAPKRKHKDYWLAQFPDATLLVLRPDRWVVVQGLIDRRTPQLVINAQKWYTRYQRHPKEIEVERPSTPDKSYPVHPARGLG